MAPQVTPSTAAPADLACDVVVTGAFAGEDGSALGASGAALDAALDGGLAEHLTDTGFKAKVGDITVVTTLGRLPAKAVAIVGLGPRDGAGVTVARRAAGLAGRRLNERSSLASIVHLDIERHSDAVAAASVEGLLLGSHRFTSYKSDPRPGKIQEIQLPGATAEAIARGAAFADATKLARDLTNEPSSTLTPRVLASRAQEVADVAGLECTVYDEERLEAEGFGALIAVGRGSAEPVRLIELRYKPAGATSRVALIGKGITFDSGGLSLKDPRGMETMKTDMGGGAAVLGAMSVLGRLDVKLEVVAYIASSENMPGGNALRPGDVITHYGGKTTEVLNTDAEGRLILADALAFASKEPPDAIVDIATLTGSIHVALGNRIAGLFTNDDALGEELVAAGEKAGEKLWRMPMTEEFKLELVSDVADQKNVGSRWGGSIIAATFLAEFVGKGIPWAHLDIAGTARSETEYDDVPKGASGFGARTLLEWIEGRAP
jgi:leucyl aminopeptidase